MNQIQLIIQRDIFQKQIADMEAAIATAKGMLTSIDEELSAIEDMEEFEGPYTVDNPPMYRDSCLFAYPMHSYPKIEDDTYSNLITDKVLLAAGLIFPDTPKGRKKAEARLKRGNVQMYIPAEPLKEPQEVGERFFSVGDKTVFVAIWNDQPYGKAIFDEGLAFEHTPEGVLGAFLKFQQLKNETKSWKKSNN
jgi:hypothetical protein